MNGARWKKDDAADMSTFYTKSVLVNTLCQILKDLGSIHRLSVLLSVCLSACLSVRMCVSLFIYLYLYLRVSVSLLLYLSLSLYSISVDVLYIDSQRLMSPFPSYVLLFPLMYCLFCLQNLMLFSHCHQSPCVILAKSFCTLCTAWP